MKKEVNITKLTFEGDYLILEIDNQEIKLLISEVSSKLLNASDSERQNYSISPSGYGIHWQALDEDLSINGMMIAAEKTALYKDRKSLP